LPYEPAKVLHKDTEECGDASHSTTDHEHTTTAAAVPAVMNNTQPPVSDKETAEHAGNAIQQAKAYATSWKRSENASSDTEPECDGVSAEENSTTDEEDEVAECAPARAARARTRDKHKSRTRQRQRTRATETDGAEAHIGESIYEVFQVREDAERITEILIKNDGGAQVTLVDCVLYDHGIRQGFVTNDRKLYRPLRIKGVFGGGGLTGVGTMHVYLPGCDTTTAIQAHRTHEPM
jgi:hypothetical protein